MGFNIGDIVKIKGKRGKVFFIITDIADFTMEGSDFVDIECELTKIFPVSQSVEVEMIDQDKLKLVASIHDKENAIILDFVERERKLAGIYQVPEYLKAIENNKQVNKISVSGEIEVGLIGKVEKTEITEKTGLTDNDIQDILKDGTSEKMVEEYIEKMNLHLNLLHIAMKNKQSQEIEFQKGQLIQIRSKLMELEYFQLEKRRAGETLKLGQGMRKKKN